MQMKTLKTWITAFGCLCATTALAVPSPAAPDDHTQGAENKPRVVAALVNGQPIYEDQLDPLVDASLRSYRKYGVSESITDAGRKGFQKKALQQMIATELVYQEALKLNIADLEEKVAREIAHRQAGQASSDASQNEQELTDSARRQVLIKEYLAQNGLANPKVPEAEVKDYYDNHKQKLASIADEVLVRHILIAIPEDASPEAREKARASIEEVRRLILGGSPFEEVAEEYSEDFVAENGGYLGKIQRGFMPPEFDETAFSIEPNTLSEIVLTKYGFHILEVIAKKPKGTIPPYDQIRDFIAQFLQSDYANRTLAAHVKSLGTRASIENLIE